MRVTFISNSPSSLKNVLTLTSFSFFFVLAATDNIVKHPVLVFIHGESYDWNSGNPYDGSVIAGYAELVVVTLNYRLGILGK